MRLPDKSDALATDVASGCRFAIVVSRFNSSITEKLLVSAERTLKELGAAGESVLVVRVPGAFEIPVAAKHLAGSGRFDGVLCLGCVIRGDTAHYEHICRECAHGIQQVAVSTGVPVIFGVLTVETRQQADDRAGGRLGNMGEEGARTLVEMAQLMRQIRNPKSEIRNVP